ncbi:MAG TPA: ABC transporter permease subunit [Candidatus Eisenbacteria bacterium]
MSRVLAIARTTLLEVVRERMVLTLALFGVGLVGASQVLSPLALGEGRKVVTDFGLAGSSMLATLLGVFLGSSLLHKELDRRTIYAVMAKPIRRSEFLLGKFAGLWATTAFLLVGMTAIVFLLLLVVYHQAPWVILGSMALSLAELLVIVAIVVLFSSFTTPALAAFFAIATVVAGHFAEDLHYFGLQGSALLSAVTGGVYWLLPHLDLFNARGLVVHGLAVDPARIGFASAYAGLYAAAALTAASAIFERREFR